MTRPRNKQPATAGPQRSGLPRRRHLAVLPEEAGLGAARLAAEPPPRAPRHARPGPRVPPLLRADAARGWPGAAAAAAASAVVEERARRQHGGPAEHGRWAGRGAGSGLGRAGRWARGTWRVPALGPGASTRPPGRPGRAGPPAPGLHLHRPTPPHPGSGRPARRTPARLRGCVTQSWAGAVVRPGQVGARPLPPPERSWGLPWTWTTGLARASPRGGCERGVGPRGCVVRRVGVSVTKQVPTRAL